MARILNPYLENLHAYNGKLHDRYTTCIYNIAYDTFADNDVENLLAGYVEPMELLKRAREIVFDFDYGLVDGTIENKYLGKLNFKDNFEEAFIGKYLTDEIAYESFTLWKSKVRGKLLEIVPIMNMEFALFKEIELADLRGGYTYTENIDNTHSDKDTINDKGTTSNTNSRSGNNDTGSVGSSFPVNEVSAYINLENVNYASNGASVKNTFGENGRSDGQNTLIGNRANDGKYNTKRNATRTDRDILKNLLRIKNAYNELITENIKQFNYLFMGLL